MLWAHRNPMRCAFFYGCHENHSFSNQITVPKLYILKNLLEYCPKICENIKRYSNSVGLHRQKGWHAGIEADWMLGIRTLGHAGCRTCKRLVNL